MPVSCAPNPLVPQACACQGASHWLRIGPEAVGADAGAVQPSSRWTLLSQTQNPDDPGQPLSGLARQIVIRLL